MFFRSIKYFYEEEYSLVGFEGDGDQTHVGRVHGLELDAGLAAVPGALPAGGVGMVKTNDSG